MNKRIRQLAEEFEKAKQGLCEGIKWHITAAAMTSSGIRRLNNQNTTKYDKRI
jgi:hypothetical protein